PSNFFPLFFFSFFFFFFFSCLFSGNFHQRGSEQPNEPGVKAFHCMALSGWNIKALPEAGLEAQLTGANLFSCCALIAFDCFHKRSVGTLTVQTHKRMTF
uniref:Secreted protein n=1 Tax=Falco tinnunculus TaxID=100819 RepID=A0A8C4XJM4_FALTI